MPPLAQESTTRNKKKKTDGKASRFHALIRGLRGGCPTFNTHIQLNFARRTQEVAHTNFPLILFFFPPPSNPFALLAADPSSEKTTDRIRQMTTTGSTWNPRMQCECNQIMVSRCSRFRNPKPKKVLPNPSRTPQLTTVVFETLRANHAGPTTCTRRIQLTEVRNSSYPAAPYGNSSPGTHAQRGTRSLPVSPRTVIAVNRGHAAAARTQ